MTNFDNKLNINNVRNAYTPNLKKDETKQSVLPEDVAVDFLEDGTQAAESYGRILVKKGAIENPEMVKSVKESLDFFMANPKIAAACNKSADQAFELLEADGVDCAYEKACCGAIDATYSKFN